MTTFTFTVTVEVVDDGGLPVECYNEELWDRTDDVIDEDGNVVARFLSPETMADIVMAERLAHDEDHGFEYSIECGEGVRA